MTRRKKEKSLQVEEKSEVAMSDENTVEVIEKEIDEKRMELEQIKKELEEKKEELKKIPAREISEDEKQIMERQKEASKERISQTAEMERRKAYDNQKVTGKFTNRRAPGQSVKLPYLKYADDPVKWYPFNDGGVYTIPRGFADQINGGAENDPCYYTPIFKQKTAELVPSNTIGENSQISEVDTTHTKYLFSPIAF